MREDERSEQPNPHPRNANDVGDDLMLQIDHRNDDQGRHEGEEKKIAQGRPIRREQHPRGKRRDSLDDRILNGDGLPTVATFAPQKDIAQHWDIVVESDRIPTLRAMRARSHDGLLSGQPADTDVQKAANQSPEND